MLRILSARSVVHRDAICANSATVCGYRKATNVAGKQRHGLPPSRHSGFKFDPFPPRIFTARPTHLEGSDTTLNDARRRNIELGRSLILKYGSADSAVHALYAARRRERHQTQKASEIWRLDCWHDTDSMHKFWYEAVFVPGRSVSSAQQIVGIREAALGQAKGSEKLSALFCMKQDLARAFTLEWMYPFELQIKIFSRLIQMLNLAPLKGLKEFGLQGAGLASELSVLVTDLAFRKASANQPSTFERRYSLAKCSVYAAFVDTAATINSLRSQCHSLIAFPGNTRSAVSRLNVRLKAFISILRLFTEFLGKAEVDLFLITLRRLSLSAGRRQNVFNALHHHFKQTRSLSQHHYRSTQRTVQRLCVRASVFRREFGGGRSPLVIHQDVFLKALDRIEDGMEDLMKLYYDGFLPWWDAGIQLMSSSELERQDRIARKYWLSRFKPNKEYELRQAELAGIHGCILRVHPLSRSHVRVPPKYHERALQAIARLSQLHSAQGQETTNTPARPSYDVPLLEGEAATTASRPAVPNARKAVLWQPDCHSTVKDFPDSSAASCCSKQPSLSSTKSKSGGVYNARLDPLYGPEVAASTRSQSERSAIPTAIEFWKKSHSAERLLARYRTVDLALKALNAGYGTLREKDSYLERRLKRWQNILEGFDVRVFRHDYTMFYFEQRRVLRAAAYERAQGTAKLVASDPLLRCVTKISVSQWMRPFQYQVDFLHWLYWTLTACPYPKLQELLVPIQVLRSDMDEIVTNLSRIQAITRLHDGYEKRYETTKRALSGACEDLRAASVGLWHMMEDYLNHPRASRHVSLRVKFLTSRSSQQDFFRDIRHTAQDLIVIGMWRYGSAGNRQQNVFNSLHHHVKYLRSETRGIAVRIQRIHRGLMLDTVARQKSDGSCSAIQAHWGLVHRKLCDIKVTVVAMTRLYYDEFLPLWERHISFMSPTEIERQDRIGHRYWRTQLTSGMAETSRETELSDLHRLISRAHSRYAPSSTIHQGQPALVQWQTRNIQDQQRAIKAIQRLEQLFPSQSPKSTEALQIILGIDRMPTLNSGRVPPLVQSSRVRSGREDQYQHQEKKKKPLLKTKQPLRQPQPLKATSDEKKRVRNQARCLRGLNIYPLGPF